MGNGWVDGEGWGRGLGLSGMGRVFARVGVTRRLVASAASSAASSSASRISKGITRTLALGSAARSSASRFAALPSAAGLALRRLGAGEPDSGRAARSSGGRAAASAAPSAE